MTALLILTVAAMVGATVALYVKREHCRTTVADARAAWKHPDTPRWERAGLAVGVACMVVPIPGPVDEIAALLIVGALVRRHRRRMGVIE